MILTIDHHKQRLRKTLLQARQKPQPRQARLIREKIALMIHREKPASVALVWPIGHEIDLRPIFKHLHNIDIRILLPYTTKKGNPLIFRQWYPDVKMKKGRFGTSFPRGPIAHPEMVFVPLLAFDRSGKRLGYGGGYYDRTLADNPGVKAIGYGLSCQERDKIPTDCFDQQLETIITENECIKLHSQ